MMWSGTVPPAASTKVAARSIALDQRVAGGAAGGVGLGARVVDDQRDLHAVLVEQVLLAQPVIAEVVAVIGGEHDHRVLHPAGLFEVVEQPPSWSSHCLIRPM